MEEALRQRLLATAALTAIVDRRIDWGLRPQGSPLPALCLFVIFGTPGMTFAGPDGWTRSRVQIDAWGREFKAARDAAEAIGGRFGVLRGLRETIATPAGDVRLRTFVMSARDLNDADGAGALFRRSIDVLVWHAFPTT